MRPTFKDTHSSILTCTYSIDSTIYLYCNSDPAVQTETTVKHTMECENSSQSLCLKSQ